MTTVNVNQVTLGIESFGDDDAPLVLLAGGPTMFSWPDALCERLTAAGRHVVRATQVWPTRAIVGGQQMAASPRPR